MDLTMKNKRFKRIMSFVMLTLLTANTVFVSTSKTVKAATTPVSIDYSTVTDSFQSGNAMWLVSGNKLTRVMLDSNSGSGYAPANLVTVFNYNIKKVVHTTDGQTAYYLLDDDTAIGVGNTSAGQLGTTTSSINVSVIPISNIADIVGGYYAGFFRLKDGTLKALGSSSNGQLGNALATNSAPLTINVPNLDTIYTGVAPTVLFKLTDGTVKGLGYSTNGMLGNVVATNTALVTVPVTNVQDIFIVGYTAYFKLTDGTTIKGLGASTNGQLGNLTATNTVAVTVPVSNVDKIYGNFNSAYFVSADGNTVQGLGLSNQYQLGVSTTSVSVPVTIPVSNVASIASIAIASTIFRTNDNHAIGLGYTYFTTYNTPTEVASNVASIGIGLNSTTTLLKNDDILLYPTTTYHMAYEMQTGSAVNGVGSIQSLNKVLDVESKFYTARLSNLKADYQATLDAMSQLTSTYMQLYWKAVIYMPYAELTKLYTDFLNAQTYFNAMNASTTSMHNSYSSRLSSLSIVVLDAYADKIIGIAEVSLLPADVTNALTYATALPLTDTYRASFLARVSNLEVILSNQGTSVGGGTGTGGTGGTGTTSPTVDEAGISTELNNIATVLGVDYTQLQLNIAQSTLAIVDNQINGLTDGINKTALRYQYDTILVQLTSALASIGNADIDKATTAVATAESTKSDTDIAKANAMVNALPASTNKDGLLVRLTALKTSIDTMILNATNYVSNAEITKLQADVDKAKLAVDILPSGVTKDGLLSRLAAIQVIATPAAPVDPTAAETDVLNLLNTVTTILNGSYSVSQLDSAQANLDIANNKIGKLPDSDNKVIIQSQYSSLVLQLNSAKTNYQSVLVSSATSAVVTAESTKNQNDINMANNLIANLPDGSAKDTLAGRMTLLNTLITNLTSTATSLTVQAEASKTQIAVNTAMSAVKALPQGTIRDGLMLRLLGITVVGDTSSALATATNYVLLAEANKTQNSIDVAKAFVNVLPDGSDKTSLLSRLSAIVAVTVPVTTTSAISVESLVLDLINTVSVTIDRSPNQSILDQCQVNLAIISNNLLGLADGADKAALTTQYNALVTKLASVQGYYSTSFTKAEALVQQAETTSNKTDVIKAYKYVKRLPDSMDRSKLLDRLDEIVIN